MSRTEQINLKSEWLFPVQFRIFALILLVGGMITIPIQPVASPFLLVGGLFVLTGFRGIQFDRYDKRYRSYYSFFLVKIGKWKPYGAVEMIYVNASHVSQKIYTRVAEGTTTRTKEFNAYLQFENGEKEYLVTSRHKEVVFSKMEPWAAFFQLELIDNT